MSPLLPLALSLALPAPAATLTVCTSGCDHSAIGDALLAAAAGDVVSVGAGVFTEVLVIDRPVTLRGAAGATVLRGLPDMDALRVSPGVSGVVLKDLTLQGGLGERTLLQVDSGAEVAGQRLVLREYDGAWGALTVDNAHLVLSDSALEDNRASAVREGVMTVSGSSLVELMGVEFSNNDSAGYGGAIFCDDPSDIIVDGCLFSGNSADKGAGAIYMRTGTLWVRDSVFANNHTSQQGGALWGEADLTLERNLLEENVADGVGGALYLRSGSLSASGNVWRGNGSLVDGGALFLAGSEVESSAEVLCGNGAGRGGAVYADPYTHWVAHNIDLLGNTGAPGAAVYVARKDLVLSSSLVAWNTGGEAVFLAYAPPTPPGYNAWYANTRRTPGWGDQLTRGVEPGGCCTDPPHPLGWL